MPLPKSKSPLKVHAAKPSETSLKLSDEQKEQLESEDNYLRGAAALAILNQTVQKSGVQIPLDYVFKARDRAVIEKVNHAVFELIGGVPAMAVWADANRTEFYRGYNRMLPTEQLLNGGNHTTVVVTQVPDSPLDRITIPQPPSRPRPPSMPAEIE